jgi:hypothetical protein
MRKEGGLYEGFVKEEGDTRAFREKTQVNEEDTSAGGVGGGMVYEILG